MPTTAQQVYDIALVLMDEVTDTGEILADNPNYYKTKSLSILTTLQTELLPYSISPVPVTDLSNELLVSDRIALSVLPYGLAAHLLLTDDLSSASYFNNRYDELKRKTHTSITPITDVYSVSDGMG
ncbi:hypothetical protein AB3Z07_05090 [Metabacillus halosaccharovorans]|uniref:hypothetical protein n=1 Tax=Metabacillus halosaccharovorans TaxID=930124 RepID=UPI0034CD3472